MALLILKEWIPKSGTFLNLGLPELVFLKAALQTPQKVPELLPGPGTPFINIQMPVFGSHKSMQVVRAGIHPSAGQNHGAAIPINIPAAWDLLSSSGSCLASLQSSQFSLLAELHPQAAPADAHRSAASTTELWTQQESPSQKGVTSLSACSSQQSCFPAGTSFWQIHYIHNPFMSVKSYKRRAAEHKAALKTFGSATHLSLGVLPKCFECLFKLGFFFHQIFALILTVLKTLFLLANFILQLFKLGRETKVFKCT